MAAVAAGVAVPTSEREGRDGAVGSGADDWNPSL